MDNRYKVIIANRNIYKEIELSPNMTQLKVGTSAECDVRMRKDAFFEPIELLFTKNRGQWSVVCSDNIYFSEGDVRKLISKALNHGDELTAKYQNAGGDIFNLSFIRGISTCYTPQDVNIYILDFGSMALRAFDSLNHIGGVVVASEDEKLKNFVRMIRVEMKKRKEVFSKIGITSFSSYKEAGHTDIPHIVIMIDNFIALKELYPEYEDDILNVCREGIAVGISVVMTSIQTNGISYRYMSNFSNRICLYCNQSDEYGNLFDKCRMEPKNIPGRGLVAINRVVYEYQTYLAFEGAKEIERVERIKTYIQSINAKCAGTAARKIPEVPHTLDAAYVILIPN